MEVKRGPFQGVLNIIIFNWHFYVIALIVIISLSSFIPFLPFPFQALILAILFLSFSTLLISLTVSYYVYDHSNLYELPWLKNMDHKHVLNVNAGFDETSSLIHLKFQSIHLTVCDFYNPVKHTEISIRRARKRYPPYPNTISVSSSKLPFSDQSFDYTLAIFTAHEIRNEHERIQLFNELKRVTKPTGEIIVTEHLRDLNNFIAYTIGFFHFHSMETWQHTFKKAKLNVKEEIQNNPFIKTFILNRNDTTH